MKKMNVLIATAALAFPLAFTAPLAASASTQTAQTTQAANKTTYKYTIAKNGATFFSKAKTYHTNATAPTLYKGTVFADSPAFVLTTKGKLKANTTYYVTKSIKTAATKTTKSKTFFYVKGHGWVAASALTAGQFKQAD